MLIGVAAEALTMGATSAPTDMPTVTIFANKFGLILQKVTLDEK